MPQQKTIRFSQGLRRLEHAQLQHPFNLRNSRIEQLGDVRHIKTGVTLGVDCPGGAKPWFRHNSVWITAADGILSGDFFKRRLYTSDFTNQKLQKRDLDNNVIEDPAYLFRVTFRSGVNEAFNTDAIDIEGITVGKAVDYLFVPHNENDEAGVWHYLTFVAENPGAQSGDVITQRPKWRFFANVETAYVDIYRTVEYDLGNKWTYLFRGKEQQRFDALGRKIPETQIADLFDRQGEGISASAYHFEGRLTLGEQVDESGLSLIVNEDAFVGEYQSARYWPLDIEKEDQGTSDFLGPILDKQRNFWSAPKTLNGIDHTAQSGVTGPVAKTMFNHSGRMMYGNVRIPLKKPDLVDRYNILPVPAAGLYTVRFQYEYDTPEGRVYGPLSETTDRVTAVVPWEGEDALLVFAEGPGLGSGEKLIERIEPNEVGKYVSTYNNVGANFTYTSVGLNEKILTGGSFVSGPNLVSTTVSLPNFVFMADQNRPFEVTYVGFPVPDSEEVVALTGTRLAEEEALRGYDFYVFTDKHVYHAQRNGSAVVLDFLIHGTGLLRGNAESPLYIAVRDGVAFAGTDNKIYFASGRRTTELSQEVLGNDGVRPLWTSVKDITYSNLWNEIEVGTDTGIWGYSFDQTGWIAHRDFKAYETLLDPGGSAPSSQTAPYDISVFWEKSFTPSVSVLTHNSQQVITITDFGITAEVTTGTLMLFDVQVNGLSRGEIALTGSSSFYNGNTIILLPGEQLDIIAPSVVDSNVQDSLIFAVATAEFLLPPGFVIETRTEAYDISAFWEARLFDETALPVPTILPNEEVLRHIVRRNDITITEFGAAVETISTSLGTLFDVYINGTVIGQIVLPVGASSSTLWSGPSSISVSQGDIIRIVGPTLPDFHLADINVFATATIQLQVTVADPDIEDDDNATEFVDSAHLYYWHERRGTIIKDKPLQGSDPDSPECVLWNGQGAIITPNFIEMQPIRSSITMKVKELRCDFDPLSRIVQGNVSNTFLAIDSLSGFAAFNDVHGAVRLIDRFGTGFDHNAYVSRILGTTFLELTDDARGGFTGKVDIGQALKVRYRVRTSGVNRVHDQLFDLPPGRVRYPRNKGRSVQLRVSNYDLFREIFILFDVDIEPD